MFLIIEPRDYNKDFLMLSDKTKNNIMNDGYFHRLYYSDEDGTSQGLFLGFELHQVSVDKYFNKLKCEFDAKRNTKIIEFIKNIEKSVMNTLPDKNGKQPTSRIGEQLENGFIKIFSNDTHVEPVKFSSVKLLLKISGIWTSDREYGVTFRFFFIRQ